MINHISVKFALLSASWKTLIEYIVYAAIIIIGLLILMFIKRKNKLPGLIDLKNTLTKLKKDIEEFIDSQLTSEKTRYDYFKTVSRLVYSTDKLIYQTSMVAAKRRDSDIDSVTKLIEDGRAFLLPYKFGKTETDGLSGMDEANGKISQAIEILDKIIERERVLKEKKLKGN